MATTVTLESDTVDEVKALTGARTKTEAVRQALSEYIRARRRQQLVALEGRVQLRLTNEKRQCLQNEIRPLL
jgi:hypothetical protein